MRNTAVRFAALSACALIPLIAQAAPQLRAPSFQTPNKDVPILLQADEIVYDSEANTVSALGHVEIADEDRTLLADRVEYDQASDKVTAYGHVSITDTRGNVAFADHVVLTDHMRDGALQGFGALLGKTGRLAANSAQRINGTVLIAHRTVYSPCEICKQQGQRTPLWQVKAERVIYDQTKHKVRFRHAIIEVKGVPVAWVPTLSVPDPTVRYATGLLTPEVGNSTKIGYFTRLPVYVAITPSQDMTIAPMFSTSGGEVLEMEYRQRWNNGGMWLQGSGADNPNGGLGGSPGAQTYGHLFGSAREDLNDVWRTGADLQLTSNSGYMRFYDISFLDRLTNDLFLEATPGRSRFSLASYYFQGLRSTDVTSRIPYILPRLELSYIPVHKVVGGTFRFDLNGVAIGRDNQRNDQRFTGEMNWKKPFVLDDGQLWTFVIDARGDAYHFDVPRSGPPRTTDDTLERGTGYVALDWRWPFLANDGPDRSYILQPIAQFIAQPYGGNPRGLRIEDSQDFEFADNNVFSFNQVPGYDVIESGPRANVGVMAEALFPGGKLDAQLGQTYRLKSDPLLAAFSGNSGTASDVVGSLSVRFPHLDITDRIDMDRSNGTIRRHEIYVTGTYNRSSLQVSYVQLPQSVISLGLPGREEINFQADANVWRNLQVFVAAQRDLTNNQFLNTEYGLGYEDECLAISLAYRRKYTEDLVLGVPPSTSVILRFSLKTGDTAIQPFSLFPRDVFALTHP
ncbi:MAG TPA: LPS assembly protein LptD [Rhizomicrobium sp.]|jgi:LPS-assembly protein|nr:LPS assembly protein LptD [Rhizomicrobium sp.]